jgi:hypothetical protein
MSQGPPGRQIHYDDDEGTPPSVWVLIWTIYVAKLVTLVLVIWAAHDYEATSLIAATTWPWLALAGALGIGPLVFQLRLRRVRAKRAQLHRSEWLISPSAEQTSAEPAR